MQGGEISLQDWCSAAEITWGSVLPSDDVAAALYSDGQEQAEFSIVKAGGRAEVATAAVAAAAAVAAVAPEVGVEVAVLLGEVADVPGSAVGTDGSSVCFAVVAGKLVYQAVAETVLVAVGTRSSMIRRRQASYRKPAWLHRLHGSGSFVSEDARSSDRERNGADNIAVGGIGYRQFIISTTCSSHTSFAGGRHPFSC